MQEGHSAFFCSKLGTTFRLSMVNSRERLIARQKEGFERVCDYVWGEVGIHFFQHPLLQCIQVRVCAFRVCAFSALIR